MATVTVLLWACEISNWSNRWNIHKSAVLDHITSNQLILSWSFGHAYSAAEGAWMGSIWINDYFIIRDIVFRKSEVKYEMFKIGDSFSRLWVSYWTSKLPWIKSSKQGGWWKLQFPRICTFCDSDCKFTLQYRLYSLSVFLSVVTDILFDNCSKKSKL